MHSKRRQALADRRGHAVAFAALGDDTRLAIVTKLAASEPQSIMRLTEGTRLTRQAVTKHLRVLEDAGVVESVRAGREMLFAFRPEAIAELKGYLTDVSAQWDDTLGRLKAFVED